MKSMMSNHDTNSKGLESSSGQTGANDDIIIKVEPVGKHSFSNLCCLVCMILCGVPKDF